MKHSTIYLYNIEPALLSTMPYKQAIKYKIQSAQQLLSQLLIPPYTERDDERISAVHKSISFNKQLLTELQE